MDTMNAVLTAAMKHVSFFINTAHAQEDSLCACWYIRLNVRFCFQMVALVS